VPESVPPSLYHGPITYFKRFRMEAGLANATPPEVPPGFEWQAWEPGLLDAHASVLCASFEGQIDSVVFSSLGDAGGCRNLMATLVLKAGFVPGATWLLVGPDGPCGSVQGLRERRGSGAIQNVGIVPRYRCRGLGAVLVRQAMVGFREAGLTRVSLEVTAQNERAERLYRRLGFRRVKTLYKAVQVSSPPCSYVI
jgi:ribosomal protein S18 acetylase RimI-like enzyme